MRKHLIIFICLLVIALIACDKAKNTVLPVITPETPVVEVMTEPETPAVEVMTEPEIEQEPPFVMIPRYIDGVKQDTEKKVFNTFQGFLDDERYTEIINQAQEYNEKYCGKTRRASGNLLSILATTEALAIQLRDYMLENHADDVKLRYDVRFTDHNDPENWWLTTFVPKCK